MNFATMLSTGPTIKSSAVRLSQEVTDARIKAAEQMRQTNNERYRKAFANYPDMTASTVQVANHLGQTSSPTVKQLKIMSERDNPVVKKIGEIPHERNGNPTFIWKWIGS